MIFYHLTDYIGSRLIFKLPELRELINTIPDVKYVGIKSEVMEGAEINGEPVNEETKWLFEIDDVDLFYRNTNGYAYPYWQNNTQYEAGEIVTFNYSNFKCLRNHTSTNVSTSAIKVIKTTKK